ncbi:MAG: MarR family transcriptional regulator [Actinomycetota bacterium]|nr:MarR family transcriptional regulator [Actinomycetota bacterium]
MVEEAKRDRLLEAGFDSGLVRLLVPLGLAFKRTVAVVERETGVSARQWFALSMLGEEDGISQGDMCQRFGLDPSRLTRVAQALEREGMIRRERDPEDNRVVRMYLTGEGREKLRHLPGLGEELRRRINGVLSDEETKELRRMLTLLAGAMKD